MKKISSGNFVFRIKDTVKKQFEKKQLISKLIILLITFAIVFIPSFIVYLKIYNSWCIEKNTIWHSTALFNISPGWNEIKNTYPIWTHLAKRTNNWLNIIRLLVILFGIFSLSLCWCFINNKIVFSFSMIAYFGIMFNWIDCMIAGTALDYLVIKPQFAWIYQCFFWPENIPFWLAGKTPALEGAFNLPDIFLSLGIIGTISGFVVLLFFKIEHSIYKKDLRLQGIYI